MTSAASPAARKLAMVMDKANSGFHCNSHDPPLVHDPACLPIDFAKAGKRRCLSANVLESPCGSAQQLAAVAARAHIETLTC